MKKIELLAPAGDLQRLKIAVLYGADAVYIGGKKFSLRSRASNFDLAEIKEGVEFAKQHDSHIHVTVNMIPHEEDLEGLEEYLIELENIGVTAIICASVYIVQVAKRVTKNLEVHLSTQQSSLNSLTVAYYQELGVDRVVLGRELTIDEIEAITRESAIPIETFIHGGMCTNYSGRCTLSNYMTLRDANRGGCAQSCRWKYQLFDQEEEISREDCLFSMSSKDLMAAEYLPRLIDSGVCSIKIEGRMKSLYYIATVVKAYRQLIDEYYHSHTLTEERMNFFYQELAKAENRPTADGFLGGLPTAKTHLYGINGAGVTHDFLAIVLDEKEEMAYVEVRNYFKIGDELEVFGPTIDNASFIVTEIIDEDGEQLEVCNNPMKKVYLKIPFSVQKDDLIRRKN